MAEVQTDYYEEMFKEITKKFYYDDENDIGIMDELVKDDLLDSTDGVIVADDNVEIVSSFENDTIVPTVSVSVSNGFETSIDITDTAQLAAKFTLHEEDNWICSDETIPWTTSKIASYSSSQKLFRCNECECIGFLSRIAEHWLGSHANLRVFQCSQCAYASAWARCVKMHLARQHHDTCPEANSDEDFQKLMKISPVLDEVTKYLEKLKSKWEPPAEEDDVEPSSTTVTTTTTLTAATTTTATGTADNMIGTNMATPSTTEIIITGPRIETAKELIENSARILDTNSPSDVYTIVTVKRYNCEHCSYATDRKDLFTRHENIHREEKPFQCNVCQKQFNRADHIKKHFIRMHRDHEYVLSNVRRPKPTQRSNTYARQKDKPCTLAQQRQTAALQAIIQRQLPTATIVAAHDLITTTTATTPTAAAAIVQNASESHPTVIQSTNMQEFLQQTDAEPMDISFFGTHTLLLTTTTVAAAAAAAAAATATAATTTTTAATTTTETKAPKTKQRTKKYNIEKNVQCSYCSWTGADNWCLKRHLNTHLKPYVCAMCEYKAARSERLTTHIFRVHNKRACTKCNFLADDINQLTAHQSENHKGMKSRKKLVPGVGENLSAAATAAAASTIL